MKRDKLDALFSRYIKLLSGGYCKRCHKYLGIKSRGLHNAHCYSRGKLSTRFVRDNCQALCYGCHRYLDQHPTLKFEFFMEILGKESFDKLTVLSNTPATGKNKLDREAIYKDLKEKIKFLEG
jgi:hypothetical protein